MRIHSSKSIVAVALLLAVGVFGCSLEDPRSNSKSLKIILDDHGEYEAMKRSLGTVLDNFSNGFLFSVNPTSSADFNCFAVNVTGQGITPNSKLDGSCTITDNMRGRGPGVLTDTVPRGSTIQLDIPTGTARYFDVYGVYPSTASCNGGNGSDAGYFLGRQIQDISGPADVVVPISFAAGTAASVTCTANSGSVTLLPGYGSYYPSGTAYSLAPNTPSPLGPSGIASNMLAGEVAELGVDNGTVVTKEFQAASAAQMMVHQFVFDVSTYFLGGYTGIEILWKGRAGIKTTSCAGGTLTGANGAVYIYNNGTTNWESVGSPTTVTGTAIETVQASFGALSSYAQPYSGGYYLIIRVRTDSIGSGDCESISTDYIQARLTK